MIGKVRMAIAGGIVLCVIPMVVLTRIIHEACHVPDFGIVENRELANAGNSREWKPEWSWNQGQNGRQVLKSPECDPNRTYLTLQWEKKPNGKHTGGGLIPM